MDPVLLLFNAGIALVMTVQVNFYFNSVFGKESSKPAKWMYLVAFFSLDMVYLSVPLDAILSSLLALAVILCLSQAYEAELRLRVVFSILYAVLFTLVNIICVSVIDPSISLTENRPALSKGTEQLLLLFSCIVMFAVIQIIRLFASRRSYTLNNRYYLLFLIVPIISIYQVNVLLTYSEKNVHYFLSVTGFVILNVLVVYVLDTVITRFQLMHENDQLQKQMDYQDANYEKTVHSFKKIKSIIHDTNQQFLYVSECIERGRTAEASEHIRVTLNKIEEAYHRVNTGNLVIDALVTNALNIGQGSGIRIDTELYLFDRELPIERYDLCVVLGNMLDNAIEASKRVKVAEDRHIRVHIRSSESALFIRIRNYVNREVTDLRSRKNSPDYHGFGLINIKRICEKYGGHMTIETESRMFDNMVVLPFGAEESPA
ncbi:ATP-binding protein [Paenibacillus sambharensis]|uniref:ATP-binding protein n=1 Tax=Paenibacillus sambharensis TaxID=1803190 RepID=A0A2W1LQ49_9BACL|nr:sensor histidine kinase [Paenibacillus sambharensis]PZD96644.1 ATP-binding protein [Paenibacillus sambharensis]